MRLNETIEALGSICRWDDLRIKPRGTQRVRSLADEKSCKGVWKGMFREAKGTVLEAKRKKRSQEEVVVSCVELCWWIKMRAWVVGRDQWIKTNTGSCGVLSAKTWFKRIQEKMKPHDLEQHIYVHGGAVSFIFKKMACSSINDLILL